MSAPAVGAPAAADPGTSADTTVAQRWRTLRAPVAVLVLLAVIAVASVVARGIPRDGYLDPTATTDAGSRAVAQVLADQGSPVTRVGTVDAALAASGTVVVPLPEVFDPADLRRLGTLGADRRLVLVGPEQDLLDAVAPGVVVGGVADLGARRPVCEAPLVAGLDTVDLGGTTFDVGSAPVGAQGCFAVGGEALLVTLPPTDDRGETFLLGSPDMLVNDTVADRGNAALALRLLDADAPVTWLLPTPAELLAAQGEQDTIRSLLPDRLLLALLQLGLAVVVVAVWRARRLGPVVAERLPVVVRAVEAVEGRGRLYTRAKARDRAAAALRSGTVARLRGPLGLPPDAEPSAVVFGVTDRTGRRPDDVGGLLYGAAPGSDAALVSLARTLDALAVEVLEPRSAAPDPEDTPS